MVIATASPFSAMPRAWQSGCPHAPKIRSGDRPGLHCTALNATEGFGIVGPLGGVTPSWRWLGLAGLIGGGPTFLGSLVGYEVTSDPLTLSFYALAAGAILYVIGEIWHGIRRYGHRELGLVLLAAVGSLAPDLQSAWLSHTGGG